LHSRGLQPHGSFGTADLILNLHYPHGKGAYRMYFSISIISVIAWGAPFPGVFNPVQGEMR